MDTDDPRLQPADTSDTRQDKDFTSPSEDDTQVKQSEQIVESEGVSDDVPAAADDVQVLPGSGGPDDVGEIDVDPDELNLSGDSIPGHPKPEAGE
ncbi:MULTISPECIES: hypothetical protein [Clavibacter]|uniref:hypothetical protein n=1 Tax=Clavibacter TaxID=1573 RepID=UPI001BE02E02|nr:hypothetical protein [Clavibacter michiganensis]MBT1634387.1 hypothetical protein [Clavibacter michiganensis]